LKEIRYIYINFLKGKITYIAFAVILTTISAFLTSSLVYLLKLFINKVFIEKEYKYLYSSPIIIFFLGLIISLFNVLSFYYFNKISFEILLNIRERLLEKILKLSYLNFYEKSTGYYLNILSQDVLNLQNLFINVIPFLIRNTLLALFLIIGTFLINFKFALISYLTIPILILAVSFINKHIRRYYHKIQNLNDKILNLTNTIINSLKEIKILNLEEKFLEKYKEQNRNLISVFLKNKFFEILSPNLSQFIFLIIIAFLFFIAGKYILEGSLSVGGFVAFITALVLVLDPIKRIAKSIPEFQQASISLKRIQDILDKKEEILKGKQISCIDRISFKNVYLKIKDKEILKNINLEFKKGKKYGIVGPSGSGKTSLINLIVGLIKPSLGEIYINKDNLKDINLRSLREKISIVSQDIIIFPGTILENLKIVNPKASYEDILKACKKAQILDFIESLPDKFNTILGPGGVNLSGGQKQRLAIARAILKNGDVLIMDEATSALDAKTERTISKIIDENFKDKILIVIAHRLSTILNSDEIIVLKNGKVEAIGKYPDILKTSPTFKELYKNFKER